MINIAILDDYAGVSTTLADWSTIENAHTKVFNDTITAESELVSRLNSFDVICIMRERTPFNASLIDQLPNLKLLVTSGPRNLSVDLEAATAKGVVVCGTESRKTTTSELSMLLMLSMSREFIPEVNSMNSGNWQNGLGRDLHGLDLGLIGLGKIGVQMSVLGKAFGMRVHAWSPNLTQTQCDEHDVNFHPTLNNLMAASDVVSMHMVLSERSRNLVDKTAFAAMRDRALFINTSRGPLTNEHDLIAGMHMGKPWKAAIDVYGEEPLPKDHFMRDEALIESGRLLLSPHLGYATEQTFKVFYTQTVEAVVAWQQGDPVRVLNN